MSERGKYSSLSSNGSRLSPNIILRESEQLNLTLALTLTLSQAPRGKVKEGEDARMEEEEKSLGLTHLPIRGRPSARSQTEADCKQEERTSATRIMANELGPVEQGS